MPDEDPIGDAIIDRFQRSTLPFDQPRGGAPGTAFLYNHLLESTANSDRVIELLITATALAQGEFGELGLRADMIEPRGAASSVLILPSFRDQWTHDTAFGVAFMTTASLHAHGRRKGWKWVTQEVTDGVAARSADIAGVWFRAASGLPPRARTRRPKSIVDSGSRHGPARPAGHRSM